MNKIISDAAKRWLGTPFHLQGRIKHVGCDCLGLLMGLAKELNLKTKDGTYLADCDRKNYHIIHDGKILEEELDKLLIQNDQVEEGNLLLLEYDNNPQHLGVVTQYNAHKAIIHAHIKHRKVVEHILDCETSKRIKKSYKLTL